LNKIRTSAPKLYMFFYHFLFENNNFRASVVTAGVKHEHSGPICKFGG